MSYEYVGEILHSRFVNYRDGVADILKSGRTVTRSRFQRLTVADDRKYAERFAKLVAPKFKPEKATYKTGVIDNRHVIVMAFQKHAWLFCEPRKPKETVVEQAQSACA